MQNKEYPLVSVGVPTFNRPDGLQKTLEEICNQTYKNLEIIVSDNHSNVGDAEKISKNFINDVTSLRFYRQHTNIGAIENLNFVLSKASGKYFIWMADDDRSDSNLISILVEALEENEDAVLCGCDVSMIDIHDNTVKAVSISALHSGSDWNKNIRKFFMCPISNVFLTIYGMYSVPTLRTNNIYLESVSNNKSMAIEIPFLARLALCGEIIAVPKTLKYYRVHDESVFTLEQQSIKILEKFLVNQATRYKLFWLAIKSNVGAFEKLRLISAIFESAILSILVLILPQGVKEFIKKRI